MTTTIQRSKHPLAAYINILEAGGNLLADSPDNVLEVVGILYSYGVVLDAYSKNLIYIAQNQFLPSSSTSTETYLSRSYCAIGGTIGSTTSTPST